MRRGCGQETVETGCLQVNGPSGNYHAKSCTDECDSTESVACNNGTDILNQFASGNVKSCQTCSDHLNDPFAESDCAAGDASLPCPLFADAACFSSRVSVQTAGQGATYTSDTYHGCSAFRITQDTQTCFNVETNDPSFENPAGDISTQSVCKETCGRDNCNDKLTGLPGDGDGSPISHHYCHACQITVNHLNETVGNGMSLCWDNPGALTEIECPMGENFCITDMEVDWMWNGDQHTTLKRGCAAQPAPTYCQSGGLGGVYQFKDCVHTCSNNLLSACNSDLTVAAMFVDSINPVKSCVNCEVHPDDDSCGDLLGPDASRKFWPCPEYANAGCFTSVSRHEEGGKMIDDTIRGCSTFTQEYDCSTQTQRNLTDNIGEIEFTTCKEACSTDNCNTQAAVIGSSSQCYVCSVTLDNNLNMVGLGDINCVNEFGNGINDTYLWDCGKDSVCNTHMEVMWLPMGNQHTVIERKCGVAGSSGSNMCTSGSSNAWLYKDCWEQCDGDKCNDNLDITKNFAPPSGQPSMEECYTCTYEEIGFDLETSPIVDQLNCKEAPTELTKSACPSWAKAGCFVGDSVQLSEEGDDIVNVYRGCSSFYTTDDQICSALTLDTIEANVTRTRTSICKQACNNADDCNTYRYPDWQPPADGECPDECLPPVSTTPGSGTTQTTTPSAVSAIAISPMLIGLIAGIIALL